MDDTTVLPGPHRREWPWIALLLIVACGLRCWHLAHTEVTTRDSIGFIRFAWQLTHLPPAEALRANPYHPLYPIAIMAASKVIVPLCDEDLPRAMQYSAQAVNAVVSVLLVGVLYLLGRELFHARVGFWGAMLFQLLPSSGRLLGDGLSEPLFFLWSALALWAAARGLRNDSPRWMAALGVFSGLAYLTRPEGLLIAAVAVLVVVIARRALLRAVIIVLPLLLVAVPYMATIRGVTAKPSAGYFLDPNRLNDKKEAAVLAQPLPFAKWELDWGKGNDPSKRWGWAFGALLSVVDRAFLHGLELFAALACWLTRDRWRRDPAFAVCGLLSLLMLALCYRVAQSNGYLSERHVMLVFLVGIFWTVVGIDAVARRMPRPMTTATVFLLTLSGIGLARTAQPLHTDRAGFRQAGEWIAANTLPGDKILDPYAHAYYHSGRIFTEGRTDLEASRPDTCYVVLEKSNNQHPHLHHLLQHAFFLAERGEEVARIDMERKNHPASIVVYRVRWKLQRNVGG